MPSGRLRARPRRSRLIATARTRRRLGVALAALGITLLAVGAGCLAQLRIALARGPMLVEPFGIAVAADGRVLVGVDASRVHVYDPEGGFLQAWLLPEHTRGGRLRIRTAEAGRVQVATERSGRLLGFDPDGGLASDAGDPGAFARFGPEHDFGASALSGQRYSIASGGLVRLGPGPETPLVPPLRWPLRVLAHSLALVPVLLLAGPVAIFAGLALTARAQPTRRG